MKTSRRKFIKIGSVAAASIPLLNLESKAELFVEPTPKYPVVSGLEKGFLSPPQATKSACYWWWFNARVDKEGITRDLTEFREKGIAEVVMINSAGGLSGVPYPAGVPFLGEEWKELYRFAMKEAKRVGIDVGINLCSGWSMGGPWIKPENSCRWYLQSQLTVTGPQKFATQLPLPNPRDRYNNVFNPPGYKDYIDLPLDKLDYRDTAVVAFPVTDEINNQITGERSFVLPAKNNHRDATSWSRASDSIGPTLYPWQNHPADKPIPVSQVIDLTAKFSKDGTLNWDVPPGKWVIVRTGHRMTGSKVMVAQPEGDGLSIDWFDHKSVEIQFENLGKVFIEEAAKVGAKPKYFCDDSFEDGFPNWTANIVAFFKKYRGYDPVPYMPALLGYIIGSAEVSDRFLHDYRKTLADCMADEHYKRFADLCHEQGILMQNESAGPSRSSTVSIDGLKNLGRSDFPMGEFWLGINHDKEGGLSEDLSFGATRIVGGADGQNLTTKMVATASHIYGKETASAEAFTSYRHWVDAPGTLKQALDRAFCEGINRIALHTSTASKPSDGKPGYEYGAGTHFNPNVTWWEKSGAFFKYVARCQYLLRSGKFVADVLYYNGDWAPNLVDVKKINPDLGSGYDYDVCNEEVLLTRLSVKNGRLVLPDGMSYRILVLPDTKRMPLAVLKKLKELVKGGATISGVKPIMDTGLRNYPLCDQEIRQIATELWGKIDDKNKVNHYGSGRVFTGVTTRNLLLKDGVTPDFRFTGSTNFIDFIHRTTKEAEVYFLTNRHNNKAKTEVTFRIKGRRPQLWDAVSGAIMKAPKYESHNEGVSLSLEFDAFQSVFVVFPKDASALPKTNDCLLFQNKSSLSALQELNGAWQVNFDTKWGGPEKVTFEILQDWSLSTDERIKYYSGKALYTKTFDLNKPVQKGQRLFIDLGIVKDIAGVKLNGKDLGTVWTTPWMLEITTEVKPTANLLEIEVINQWPNRLIGDVALPVEKRLTNTNIVFKKTDKLLPSGLLGPVSLKVTS
ncbi:glycosyl hydrolase [Pedobacter frigiditerrae]|uniref:glycosyl hydrolase n=1 Tax=Pedobacter frigiditerrae TaxID=2530452 RepID=UPI002931B79D|nr:glycosyl hydrolase [Pedobacter frigiditerrae]